MSFGLVALLFILSNFTLADKGKEKAMSEKLTFENVILDFEKKLNEADYLYNVAEFNVYLHSDDEGLSKIMNDYEKRRKNLINDEDNFKKIKKLHKTYVKKGVKGLKRDIVNKWYYYLNKIIVLDARAKKLQEREVELQNKFSILWNRYRPKMKGANGKYIKDKTTGLDKKFNGSEIIRILSKSKNRNERKRAFEAQSAIGSELIKNKFKDLVKLRNEFAQARGYKNYYSLKYVYGGFDEVELFEMFDRIVKETEDVAQSAVKNYLKKEELKKFEPWDIDYAGQGFSHLIDDYLSKEGMIDAVKQTYKDLGIDLNKHAIKMDLEPREGKTPHAFCWNIRFADYLNGKWANADARLLANLDKGGLYQYEVLFHEMGHAVHGVNVKQKHTIDKNLNLTGYYEMGGLIEGMAMTFDKIPSDQLWFLKYANFEKGRKSKTQKEKLQKIYRKYHNKAVKWEAFNLRNKLVKVYFEREIYNNPNGDYNKIWWDVPTGNPRR